MIAIIDYRAGNLTSVKRALDFLKIESRVTQNKNEILSANHVIFPGVGAAPQAMGRLREESLDETLRTVLEKGTPLLGICLGTQIFLERSEEGDTRCLGFIKGTVRKFRPKGRDSNGIFKIPHMGWNAVSFEKKHRILQGIPDGAEFYFVHSFYPAPAERNDVYGITEYGTSFASVLGRGNLFATQFHPEKSAKYGLQLLSNFAKWSGAD